MSGMGYQFDGRELISLRGYSNNSISPPTGKPCAREISKATGGLGIPGFKWPL